MNWEDNIFQVPLHGLPIYAPYLYSYYKQMPAKLHLATIQGRRQYEKCRNWTQNLDEFNLWVLSNFFFILALVCTIDKGRTKSPSLPNSSFLLELDINDIGLWLRTRTTFFWIESPLAFRLPHYVSTARARNNLVLVPCKLPITGRTSTLYNYLNII